MSTSYDSVNPSEEAEPLLFSSVGEEKKIEAEGTTKEDKLNDADRKAVNEYSADRLPVHKACEKGASLQVIQYLIEKTHRGKETVNTKDNSGWYPLHYACRGGASLDVIKYLVEDVDGGKKTVNKKDNGGWYPLYCACRGGASLAVIKYLVEDVDGGKNIVNTKDNDGWYPLHCACRGGASLAVIKYLVEDVDGGKDIVNTKDNDGWYPLHCACRGGASLAVIKYLVEDVDGGKDIFNTKGNGGWYPLHYACRGGASLDVIKYLVEDVDGGKDIFNKKDNDGWYPLHCACRGGASLAVIKYLVEDVDGGKDIVNTKDNYDTYPLHLACIVENIPLDAIKFLIQKEPSTLRQSDGSGCIPIDYLTDERKNTLLGGSKTMAVPDKPSAVDQLGYSTYAKALAKAVRIGETPDSSLCVGLYGPWGSGKSTLWKHICRHLDAEFVAGDAQTLQEQRSSKNSRAADASFWKARAKALESPVVEQSTKDALKDVDDVVLSKVEDSHLSFAKWSLSQFLRARNNCRCKCCYKNRANDLDLEEGQPSPAQKARGYRQDERDAVLFSILAALSWLTIVPVVFAYTFFVLVKRGKHRDEEKRNDGTTNADSIKNKYLFNKSFGDLSKESSTSSSEEDSRSPSEEDNFDNNDVMGSEATNRVFGLISGDEVVGRGANGNVNALDAILMMLLWLVQAVVSATNNILETLRCWFGCYIADNESNSEPTEGLPAYVRVDFNAWAYSGSDYLWASLISELWDEVERKYTPSVVRLHRAKIAIAGDFPLKNLKDSREQREEAWLKYKFKFIASAMLPIVIALIFILRYFLFDGQPITANNATEGSFGMSDDLDEVLDKQNEVILTSILTVLSSIPFLGKLIEFFKKIFPYLKEPMGQKILGQATSMDSAKRKDFTAEKGFMGEVKKEVEYLFDLLVHEKFKDNEIGCNRSLRLCVFVDDLDRCPDHIVVKVLDAVILLLVDGPITCWLAIDSRIVVECIKASKKDVYSNAEIHGHEFLDKIIQLPFCLPYLGDEHKKSYLSKMIEANELDPRRVLSQITPNIDQISGNFGYEIRRKYKQSIEDWNKNHIDLSDDAAKAVKGLLGHYHAMKHVGHKVQRKDVHVVGMNDSDLVNALEESLFHNTVRPSLREENVENFCLLMKDEHQKWRNTVLKHPKYEINEDILPSAVTENEADKAFQSRVLSLPSKSLNVPMLNKTENDAMSTYCPFLVGNPRKLKRIINVFNVCRIIFQQRSRCYESKPNITTSCILRYVILLEQWPCRMSWLLQYIENLQQQKMYELGDKTNQLTLDMVEGMLAADFFSDFVDRIIYSSDPDRSFELMLVDSDPQLFLGLLKVEPKLKVSDFLSSNIPGKDVLKDYSFNLPFYMRGKVERILDEMTIHKDGSFTKKG